MVRDVMNACDKIIDSPSNRTDHSSLCDGTKRENAMDKRKKKANAYPIIGGTGIIGIGGGARGRKLSPAPRGGCCWNGACCCCGRC